MRELTRFPDDRRKIISKLEIHQGLSSRLEGYDTILQSKGGYVITLSIRQNKATEGYTMTLRFNRSYNKRHVKDIEEILGEMGIEARFLQYEISGKPVTELKVDYDPVQVNWKPSSKELSYTQRTK